MFIILAVFTLIAKIKNQTPESCFYSGRMSYIQKDLRFSKEIQQLLLSALQATSSM
jgi:hypothetical protein